MKLKDIVRQAMKLLNLPVDEDRFSAETVTDDLLLSLTDCANSAITDASTRRIRLYKTQTMETKDGDIAYKTLDEAIFEPVSVYSVRGREIFDVYPDKIRTSPGEVVFTYSYIPKSVAFDGDVVLPPSVTVNALAMKTASEYSVRAGLSDKAQFFDRKYLETLGASFSGRRLRPMPISYGGRK